MIPPDPSKPTGDYMTALATLIPVNALFLAFNALDAVYLYIKVDFPEGITYASYCHRGCFWLVLALALSTAALGSIFIGRRLTSTPGAAH